MPVARLWGSLQRAEHFEVQTADAVRMFARYPHVYLFQFQNMRNDKFKELREEVQATSRSAASFPLATRLKIICPMFVHMTCLCRKTISRQGKHSGSECHLCKATEYPPLCPRFCMGSNKVLKVALGKSESDEHQPGVHQLSERVAGNVGLFFTTLQRAEVEALFNGFQVIPSSPWPRAKRTTRLGDSQCGLLEGRCHAECNLPGKLHAAQVHAGSI